LQNKHLDGNYIVKITKKARGPLWSAVVLITLRSTLLREVWLHITDRAVNMNYKINLHKVKDHSLVCTVRMLKWLEWIAINIFTKHHNVLESWY